MKSSCRETTSGAASEDVSITEPARRMALFPGRVLSSSRGFLTVLFGL